MVQIFLESEGVHGKASLLAGINSYYNFKKDIDRVL